ncbi:hypothetical protein DFH09DRAFT_1081929 [Mycena vulgaris]|nr:hypothetical protein DFH09DRAFT_1081929 [Mycena vulgaris]
MCAGRKNRDREEWFMRNNIRWKWGRHRGVYVSRRPGDSVGAKFEVRDRNGRRVRGALRGPDIRPAIRLEFPSSGKRHKMYPSRETCHLARAPRQPSGDEHLAGSLLVAFRPACTVGSEMSTLRRKLLEGVKREQKKHACRLKPSGSFDLAAPHLRLRGEEELILDNVLDQPIVTNRNCNANMTGNLTAEGSVAVLMPPPRLIARGLRPEDNIGLARRAGRDEYASKKSGAAIAGDPRERASTANNVRSNRRSSRETCGSKTSDPDE